MSMRNRYLNYGWLITLIVAILPVVLWQIAMPTPWDTAKNIFENIGRLAGLAGIALFAWNVILSARFKIYNRLFKGLDNLYRAHHIIGSIALILLLIHPVMITYRYFLSSPISAYEFIKPNLASPFRILGNLALFAMLGLMIITLYIKVRYEWFIIAQRLLGLVLFIGAVHAVFVGGSNLGANNGILSLQIYFAVLIGLALFVYVYRSIFHGNFNKFLEYKVVSSKVSGDNYELVLAPIADKLAFMPGQYSFIKVDSQGVLSQSHPFSMSSSPSDANLSFGIKVLGDFTMALKDVEKGSVVKVDGPYGTFSNNVIKAQRQVWIAGGIGVTPFMSMAKALGPDQQVDLYYSVKQADDGFYLDELRKLAAQKSNLKLIFHKTEKDGFLTTDMIFSKSKDLFDAAFLICGPASLMKAMKEQLRAKGVKKKYINTEEFNLT